jgi:hypothetical protein
VEGRSKGTTLIAKRPPCGWASAAGRRSWEGRPRLHTEQGTGNGWASTQAELSAPVHPPSALAAGCCVQYAASQSGHPAGWLFRFCPVVAETGRKPLSAVTFASSSPSAGRSVRSGSPAVGRWQLRGSQYTCVLRPKFSSMPYEAPRYHPPTVSEESKGPVTARSFP